MTTASHHVAQPSQQSKGDVWRERLNKVCVPKGSTLLHYAAKQEEEVAIFICASMINCFINALDNEGNTALHVAVRNNNLATARALLMCGADARIRNKVGLSVEDEAADERIKPLLTSFKPGLVQAVTKGDKTSLLRMIRRWCHPYSIIKNGKSALEILSSDNATRDCLTLLQQHLPTLELLQAVCRDDPNSLSSVLSSISDMNIGIRLMDCHGRTPLQIAIENRSVECVKLLLASNICNVYVRAPLEKMVNSTVPLFFLALEKDCPVEILQNLLNAMQSSDLEERDENGYTAVAKAIVLDTSIEVIELLLSQHTDFYLTSRDRYGRTIRDLASQMKRYNVQRLIDYYVASRENLIVFPIKFYDEDQLQDVIGSMKQTLRSANNATHGLSETQKKVLSYYKQIQAAALRLFRAAIAGDTKTIMQLNTADFQDRNGLSALIHAVVHSQSKAVETLLIGRPSLRFVADNFGRYPLHYAYALPEVVSNAIVRLLLENNEPKMEILRDKDGRVPVEYKDLRDSPEVHQILNNAMTMNPLETFEKCQADVTSLKGDVNDDQLDFDSISNMLMTCLA